VNVALRPLTRDTGIEWLGRIPAGWPLVRLKRVAVIQSGLTLGKDYGDQPLVERPYLRVANVQDGFLDLAEITTVRVPADDVTRHELRRGDVLMTEGGDFDKLGRGYVWEGQIEGCLHQNHVFAVRPDTTRLESHFLAHLMTSSYGRAYFTSTSQQTTNLASTNSTKLGDFPVPLPPMPLQRAIVAFLGRKTIEIDAVIAAKERMIGLQHEKRQALVGQAVTRGLDPSVPVKDSGTDWIGPVPAHWAVERLKFRLSKGIEQGWSPQCENRQAEPGEWGVLKVGCMNSGVYDESENKALPASLQPLPEMEVRSGDVLMSRSNTVELVGTVGIVHQTRGRIVLCDKLYRIDFRPDALLPEYAVYLLRSRAARLQIERDATGASPSMKNISTEIVGNILLAFPPLDEQRQILARIRCEWDRIDSTVNAITEQLAKLREYRQTLISAAVTGKTDVAAP
jgi:type I restriction enzyme S subunit